MKNVLVLCTGNSCRSIIAEGLINKYLSNCAKAYSAGVRASGRVNPNAKAVLRSEDAWDDGYHSKTVEDVLSVEFDLVVTVCDHAKETCPMFPGPVKTIHVGFEDPDGKELEAFEETKELIKKELLPVIEKELGGNG